VILLALLPAWLPIYARTIDVSLGGTYPNLEAAAAIAEPGDTILFHPGVYAGGQYVENLQGRADAWITITGTTPGSAVVRAGTNGWQLPDAAYLRIRQITFEQQSGNGLNLDDAGSFETPAHHLILDSCIIRDINATGNNDLLKMSGIDSFEVRNCQFSFGSPGGSMIDMVGCHHGIFERNIFQNGGSNSIQAKGGTSDIRIQRNYFYHGGSRTLNIGGSTGLAFFRPQGINYEAANIKVYSNIFQGSEAPIAFVGAVHCEVVNNTIYLPTKWAIRILQETTEASFLQCGYKSFINKIICVVVAADSPTLNIGGNTRPESFTFSNNLWFHTTNGGWGGPNLPVAETNGITGRDPLFLDVATSNLRLYPASPAIKAGADVAEPTHDYFGNPFNTPRSIGAMEGDVPSTSVAQMPLPDAALHLIPNPSSGDAVARFTLPHADDIELALCDATGRVVRLLHSGRLAAGTYGIPLAGTGLPPGNYLLRLRGTKGTETVRAVVVR
jgi:hypothetical protein